MDHSTIGNLFSGPGSDTRQWISGGTVDISTKEKPSVRFKDANGKILETGPLVDVTLQPSGIPVTCRVGSDVAGNGEGEWYPFVDKDEVLVAIPGGDESGYPVIIKRLNQGVDLFPEIVAGQDATENKFGFRRMRAPYVIETAQAYIIRHATTGAQIGIDANGQVIINDSEKGRIFFSPDVIELSSGDKKTFVQVQVGKSVVAMKGGGSTFSVGSDIALMSKGTITLGSSGAGANQHAVTAEQIFCWTANLLFALSQTGSFAAGPLGPTALTSPAAMQAAILAVLTPLTAGLILPSPPTNVTGGGNMAPFATAFSAMKLAMSSPVSFADPTGFIVGFGRAGIVL